MQKVYLKKKTPKQSYLKKLSNQLGWVGFGIGILFWVLESAIHSFLLTESIFVHQLIKPSINEIWMRGLVLVFLTMFGIALNRTVHKLSEHKRQMREMLANVQLATVMLTRNGKITYVNNYLLKMTGYSKREIIGGNWFDLFIPPENREEIRGVHNKVLAGKMDMVGHYESEIVTKSGDRRTVSWSNTLFNYSPDGKISSSTSFGEDITERKLAEERLQQLNQQLRTSIDQMPTAYILWDCDFRVLEWNNAAEQIFGYSKEEALGETIADLIVPEPVRHLVDGVLEKLRDGESISYSENNNNITKAGTLISCQWHNQPLINNDGDVFAILSIAEDVTERIQADQALRQSEDRLNLAMSVNNDGMYDWDVVTNEIYFDRRYYTMAGYEPDEFPGTFDEWAKRVHPDDFAKVEQSVKSHLAGEIPKYDVEFRFKCKDDHWMWIRARVKVVERDEFGVPLRIVGTHTDITERKLAEEKIKQSEHKYRTLFGEMDESFVLHEIICDDDGKPCDYRFLEANSAFEKQVGIDFDQIVGKTALEIFPETEPYWIEAFGEVALSGKSAHFENYSQVMDKYFDVTVYSPEENKFAAIFLDVTERKQAETALHSIIEGTSRAFGEDFFRTLTKSFACAFDFEYAFIGEFVKPMKTSVRTLAFWDKDDYRENFEYNLAGTPCENVTGHELCLYPKDIQQIFPDDHILTEMGIQSYLGIPLFDSSGNSIGIMVVMDTKPMKEDSLAKDVLPVFAARVEAELERQRDEASLYQYEHIVSSSTDMMAILDMQFQYLAANKSYLEAFGFSPKELIGNTIANVLGEDIFKTVIKPNMTRCACGEIVKYEDWFDFPVYGRRYMEINYYPYYDEHYNVIGFVVNGRNITERKHAEEESQSLAKFPSENPNPVIRVSSDGTVLYANEAAPAVLRALGCEESERLPEAYRHIIEDVLLSFKASTIESHCSCGKTFSLTFAPVPDESYVNIYGFDITERKRAENELRNNEERFRVMYENSPLGYQSLDTNGCFLDVNPAWLKLVGASYEDVIGRSFGDFMTDSDREKFHKNFPKLKKTGSIRNAHFELIHSNGNHITVELNGNAAYDENGNFRQSYCILRDVTEINQAKEREEQHQEELAHASRLSIMGQMTSELAHELNQPLCAIMGNAESSLRAVKSKETVSEKVASKIETIVKQTDRASKIISRIRHFAVKNTGKRSTVHVNNVISEAMEIIGYQAKKSGVKIEFDLRDNINPIFADQIQLEQVTLNLIQNGIDALREIPKSERKLTISTRYVDRCIEVAVRDSGVGINEKDAENILEPFFTTKSKGLGIGLSISRSIIEAHGGKLSFRDNSSDGVTFYYRLPVDSKINAVEHEYS
jgi:PAS domain S-box-containing protein